MTDSRSNYDHVSHQFIFIIRNFFPFFPGSKDHEWIRRWKIMIICCSSHKFPFSPSFSFILRPVRIFQLLLILILNTEWQMICLDLSSHVSGTGTFPELGTTLMKEFYTKLFPERSGSRSRSGTRNVATFHIPGFYGLDSSFAHK